MVSVNSTYSRTPSCRKNQKDVNNDSASVVTRPKSMRAESRLFAHEKSSVVGTRSFHAMSSLRREAWRFCVHMTSGFCLCPPLPNPPSFLSVRPSSHYHRFWLSDSSAHHPKAGCTTNLKTLTFLAVFGSVHKDFIVGMIALIVTGLIIGTRQILDSQR